MTEPQASPAVLPADKVRTFPTTPGLYLMKDAQGRVIYVGKAKNLALGPGRTFTRPRRRIGGSATGSMKSPTSITFPPIARSMPCSWRPG